MRTVRLTLAYDGTDFVGWQRQENGLSIQQLVEEALEPIEQGPVAVVAAGRTDAGVHALGQVASFRLASAIALDALVRALNARLPADVRVLAAAEAPADFHARIAARAKTYRYRIWNAPVVSPFERRYVWHVPHPLDVDAMAAAARALEGRHDFAAFQATGSPVASTTRTLFSVSVQTDPSSTGPSPAGVNSRPTRPSSAGVNSRPTHPSSSRPLIEIDLRGDGFLRHMVRNIVGTLVEVGQGRRTPESLAATLASRDRARAGPTAPAAGLVLVGVEYP
jgi:tRNA pseudouridine38-40 synthase